MQERRRAKRYRIRLDVRLTLPQGVELAAELFDFASHGCQLVSLVRLDPGQTVGASLPSMPGSTFRARVVRTRTFGLWYVAAVEFEAPLPVSALHAIAAHANDAAPTPDEVL